MNINKDKILEFLILEEEYFGKLVLLIIVTLIISAIIVVICLDSPSELKKVRSYQTEITLNNEKTILITDVYVDESGKETYKVVQ